MGIYTAVPFGMTEWKDFWKPPDTMCMGYAEKTSKWVTLLKSFNTDVHLQRKGARRFFPLVEENIDYYYFDLLRVKD